MTLIIKCLEGGVWTIEENEARTLRMQIGQYVVEDGVLLKKSYLSPMLRCVGPLKANYIIREVHEGACGMHAGPRSIVAKIMRQGYYWPTMHGDTKEVINKCDSCQIPAPTPKLPKTWLTSIMSPWPFYQWGLNILGPLPEGPGKLKFIIVAIDYFTKWIEAKPLAKITGKELVNDPFKSWCEKWKIKQMNTSMAHPQANGLVERANKSLMHGLKARLGRERNEEEMRLNLDLSQERRETEAIREAKYKKKVETYYNKRVCPMSFKVGDFVYRKNPASRVKNQGKLGPE
ncbi:reverse transcriptase domain-containing protein [Tanacetum coccineum]|uniref:Reverse transcriptase domain-containing protein n=1 Tax=Tanacetum coccineum TaxID=301880 RepID=A0ABQ4YG29_9ASTR